MKIAIFGGSFDPVHAGHEKVIELALATLGVSKLFVVPTFISPFKDSFAAPASLRFKWLAKVLKAKDFNGELKSYECEDERIVLSDFEISQNKPVPSIITVEHFAKLYSGIKIYFIIGADHLGSLNKWHEINKLKQSAEFVVAKRGNIAILPGYKHLNVHCDISSSYIRDKLVLDQVNASIKDEVKSFYEGLK